MIKQPLEPQKSCQKNGHSDENIVFICLDTKCNNKKACLLCADKMHSKHDLISIHKFTQIMREKLQINNHNKDKVKIMKQLAKAKQQLFMKIQKCRSRTMQILSKCEDHIENYFSSLHNSLAIDSHSALLKHLFTNFTDENIKEYSTMMTQFEQLRLGTFQQTNKIIQVQLHYHLSHLSETISQNISNFQESQSKLSKITFAKPKQDFQPIFSRDKKSGFVTLNDSKTIVTRTTGSGGYPMNLLSRPFNPIQNTISFKIQKYGNKDRKSVWLGVCHQQIVKSNAYQNCNGIGKGVYAIDQSTSYYGQPNTIMSSWNHFDSDYSQTHNSSNDLVGWNFEQNDVIKIELDYFNNNVIFIKNQEEDYEVYEMPIKLQDGPLYAFVGGGSIGDCVSIVQ